MTIDRELVTAELEVWRGLGSLWSERDTPFNTVTGSSGTPVYRVLSLKSLIVTPYLDVQEPCTVCGEFKTMHGHGWLRLPGTGRSLLVCPEMSLVKILDHRGFRLVLLQVIESDSEEAVQFQAVESIVRIRARLPRNRNKVQRILLGLVRATLRFIRW